MTYLGFIGFYLVPVILFFALLVIQEQKITSLEITAIGTLMVIAFCYATPWDNWLVRNDIWTYAPGVVVAVIGYVPIEEYMFFLLQPLMIGLWVVWLVHRESPTWLPLRKTLSVRGGIVGLVLTAGGIIAILIGGHWLYMGLIVAWAAPVLALQWSIGGGQVWRSRWLMLVAIVPPTVYLCAADRAAIVAGIWTITDATSTGIHIADLPIEEALFFLLTNIMVAQGVLLYLWVVESGTVQQWRDELVRRLRRSPGQSESAT